MHAVYLPHVQILKQHSGPSVDGRPHSDMFSGWNTSSWFLLTSHHLFLC